MSTPVRLTRWTRPDNYIGPDWSDYYLAGFSRNRDSDFLERANFDHARDLLSAIPSPSGVGVEIVRDSHWACGWIEYILIHESHVNALQAAEELRAKYERHPILNEDDYSAREYEAVNDSWVGSAMTDRIEMCARFGASIFAARRDSVPNDRVRDYLALHV